MDLPGLRIKIGADLSAATAAFRTVEKQVSGLASRLQSVGTALTAGVTLPIVGLGVAATKTAIDFETAFAGVEKTVNGTAAEIAGLRDGIQQMAQRLPASTTQIAAVAEAAGQLGIQTDKILGFSEVMIGLGEATNLSATQAATSLARLANITGLPQDQFSNLGSAVVDLGNNFATTEAEIVELGLRLAGAGRIAGLTEGEILGLGAAVSSVGINAEAGGTAFSKVLVQIREAADAGGKELQNFAGVAGLTASEFQALVKNSPAQAIAAFVEGLGKIESSGGSATQALTNLGIVEIRMRDALLRTAQAGDLVARAMDTGSTAFAENAALATEVSKRYDTLASRLAVVRNRVQAALLPLGEVLAGILRDSLPAIEGLIGALTRMAQAFQALPGPIQKAALGVAALAAVLGPALLALGALTKALPFAAGGLNLLGVSFARSATAAFGFRVALTPLAATLGKLTLVLAAVAASTYVVTRAYRRAYEESENFRRATVAAVETDQRFARSVASLGRELDGLAGALLGVQRETEGTDRDASFLTGTVKIMTGVVEFARYNVDLLAYGIRRLKSVMRGVEPPTFQEFVRGAQAATHAITDLSEGVAQIDAGSLNMSNIFASEFGGGRNPIMPTGGTDDAARRAKTIREAIEGIGVGLEAVAVKFRENLIGPLDAARERVQVLESAFGQVASVDPAHPSLAGLAAQIRAAREEAERLEAVFGPLTRMEFRPVFNPGDLIAEAAHVAWMRDLGIDESRFVDEPEVRRGAAALDEMVGSLGRVSAATQAVADKMKGGVASLSAFGVAALRVARDLARAFGQALSNAFQSFTNALVFGSGLSEAEIQLERLNVQAERLRLQEVIAEGGEGAAIAAAQLAVLNERAEDFESSLDRLSGAINAFRDAFSRAMSQVIADLVAAIAKALIFRALTSAFGTPVAGSFFGAFLSGFGGGSLKAPVLPKAPPTALAGSGPIQIVIQQAFGAGQIVPGGTFIPATVTVAANRGGVSVHRASGLYGPGYG